MNLSKKKTTAFLLSACALMTVSAQDNNKKGYLTGSFETNTTLYQDDSKNPEVNVPDDKIGTNNYLKLDYYQGKFTAGVQLEAYQPALLGYPTELSGAALTNYFVGWTDEQFSVTAGTFYDQFGSGLLFRSWEDRFLGLNNAVMGARFTYNYKDLFRLKGIWGAPRFGMEFSETQVRGLDASLSLSDAFKWNNTMLNIEGSVLNRYEAIGVTLKEEGGKASTTGYSGRINFEKSGFVFKGEYVDGGDRYYEHSNGDKQYVKKHANAQLVELGYSGHGLGVNITGRRLEWLKNDIVMGNTSTSNMINYIPAMCTQYTYLLTNLHPYNAQTAGLLLPNFTNSGEMGGQIDVFYNFRRGSLLGGKRGMKIHANMSTYYTIAEEGTAKTGNLLFRDFSVDLEKQFTKDYKLTLLYSMQEKNPSYGANKTTHVANVFVADMQYKFTPSFSTRLELQYLTSQEDEKDWMAALLEVNFAPKWSIYVSDMYNHGNDNPDKRTHYYSGGVSYAHSRTRVALSYGRNRAGYVCSGGVCREIPAYTGCNLSITTSF